MTFFFFFLHDTSRINLETNLKLKCEHSIPNEDMMGNRFFCLFTSLIASAGQGLTSLMVGSLQPSSFSTLSFMSIAKSSIQCILQHA